MSEIAGELHPGSGAELLDRLEMSGSPLEMLKPGRDLVASDMKVTAESVYAALKAVGTVSEGTLKKAKCLFGELGKPITLNKLADRLTNLVIEPLVSSPFQRYFKKFIYTIPEWEFIKYACGELFGATDSNDLRAAGKKWAREIERLVGKLRFHPDIKQDDAGELPLAAVLSDVKALLGKSTTLASARDKPQPTPTNTLAQHNAASQAPKGRADSDLPFLDPVERSILAFLADRLDVGQTIVDPDQLSAQLRTLGAESRHRAIVRYFEDLKVLEHCVTPPPPRPTNALTSDSPETHRFLSYYQNRAEWWNITGRAITLNRAIIADTYGVSRVSGTKTSDSPAKTHLERIRDWLCQRFVERRNMRDVVNRYSCEETRDPTPGCHLTEDEKTWAVVPEKQFHDFLDRIGAPRSETIQDCVMREWITRAKGGFDVKNMAEFYVIQPKVTDQGLTRDETQLLPADVAKESNTTNPMPASDYELTRQSGMFRVRGFGEEGYFSADLIGFQQIAMLLKKPGQGVPMVQLVACRESNDARVAADEKRSPQPIYDSQARNELGDTLRELVEARNDAEANGLMEEFDNVTKKIDELTNQIHATMTKTGRQKDLNNVMNKLRPRISGTLKTVYRKMREANPPMPKLADHFEQTITSESPCFVYRLPLNSAIKWHL